jgi:phage terminase large subunit-like protein
MAVSKTKPKAKPRLKPFTLPHFRGWAGELVLDNGEQWVLEWFHERVLEDIFSGVPEVWFCAPEGNTKTTTIAGLVLYHAEFRANARALWAASSRDQAELGFDSAAGFVSRTPRLEGLFTCLPGYRRIRCSNGSKIQIFAADERTGDGVIPTLGVLDELARQRDLGLYRTWVGKLSKRGGQVIAMATAGEPGGEFEETRERIRQQATLIERDGTYTRAASDQLVLHEHALRPGDDVEDLELVAEANPFSGITVETLRAKRSSPTMTLPHWRRFTCNLPTRSDDSAVTESEWDAAEVTERIPEGEPVWVGLDLAFKWDCTAVVPLWWRDDEFRLLGEPTVLVPPRDGNSMSPHLVEQALRDLHERNPIQAVVMDMTEGQSIAAWVEEELAVEVIERGKSLKFQADECARFMEALRSGWLKHTGDPTLRQHVMNAVAKMLPRGDHAFDRRSRARQGGNQDLRVIDALDAAAMVHAAAAANPPGQILTPDDLKALGW